MQNNKWKDYILKSGLPLEFEVKKALDKLGFWNKSEFSYIRENENGIPTEFSYDIDSSILIDRHYFEVLIECKYRDESTNWFFLPAEYNFSHRGIGTTDFRNTNDFFYPKDYPDLFKILNVIEFAPLCLKGIEISTTGQNPKTIDQAISQVSYAMIDKIISGMENQIASKDEGVIYHHVPIIITTANLFRLKSEVTIDSIKKAVEVYELATPNDILLIEPTNTLDLKNHAYKKLSDFEAKYSKEELNSKLNKKLKTLGRDFEYYKNVIADFPKGIIIMKHTVNGENYERVLKVFNEIVRPSQKTKDDFQKIIDMAKEIF